MDFDKWILKTTSRNKIEVQFKLWDWMTRKTAKMFGKKKTKNIDIIDI